ncbi:MAG TPA: hypothetical protein ENN99_00425 [Chloroflexi bacterium]|nr:hypothetical protein [Chloroflexota bacterium]
MNESQTIEVQTEFDVFMARMQVRKLARAVGFDITNQARIALATSSLARALRLGETYHGYVNIDCLGDGSRSGMRVACKAIQVNDFEVGARTFTDVKWLVDELTIEELPTNDLQVTVVKRIA